MIVLYLTAFLENFSAVLFAECNLTHHLLFLTVTQGLTCISTIQRDMLHSLGRAFSPFYLFKICLVPNKHVGVA